MFSLNKIVPKEHQDSNTMKSVKVNLIILQIFGYMPLNGITSSNPQSLKFTWFSWKILYAGCNVLLLLFRLVLSLLAIKSNSSIILHIGELL